MFLSDLRHPSWPGNVVAWRPWLPWQSVSLFKVSVEWNADRIMIKLSNHTHMHTSAHTHSSAHIHLHDMYVVLAKHRLLSPSVCQMWRAICFTCRNNSKQESQFHANDHSIFDKEKHNNKQHYPLAHG